MKIGIYTGYSTEETLPRERRGIIPDPDGRIPDRFRGSWNRGAPTSDEQFERAALEEEWEEGINPSLWRRRGWKVWARERLVETDDEDE